MARVKSGNVAPQVDAKNFFAALKRMSSLAPTTVGTPYQKAGLLEVNARHNRVSLIVSDLIWGARVELPCDCRSDQRVVVDLDKKHIAGFCSGGKVTGGKVALRFDGELVSVGGMAFEKQPHQDPSQWSDAWDSVGFTKPSRSDAFHCSVAEFVEALATANMMSLDVNEENRPPLLKTVHLRRRENGWRMEATDGHRAVTITGDGTLSRDLLIHPGVAKALLVLSPMMEGDRILLSTFNRDVDVCKAGSIHAWGGLKGGGRFMVAALDPQHIWNKKGETNFPKLDQVTPSGKDCWSFEVRPKELEKVASEIHDLRERGKKKDAPECSDEDVAIVERDLQTGEVMLHHPRTNKRWLISGDSKWVGNGEGTGTSIKPLRIGFNPRYLIDAAKAVARSGGAMVTADPKGVEPLVIQDGKGIKVLVMPRRI